MTKAISTDNEQLENTRGSRSFSISRQPIVLPDIEDNDTTKETAILSKSDENTNQKIFELKFHVDKVQMFYTDALMFIHLPKSL